MYVISCNMNIKLLHVNLTIPSLRLNMNQNGDKKQKKKKIGPPRHGGRVPPACEIFVGTGYGYRNNYLLAKQSHAINPQWVRKSAMNPVKCYMAIFEKLMNHNIESISAATKNRTTTINNKKEPSCKTKKEKQKKKDPVAHKNHQTSLQQPAGHNKPTRCLPPHQHCHKQQRRQNAQTTDLFEGEKRTDGGRNSWSSLQVFLEPRCGLWFNSYTVICIQWILSL